MRTVSLAALVAASTISLAAGGTDQARKSFVASWQGKRVAVKRTMYTLVYNERGKLGKTYHAKREGLTVVTPSSGIYCRFDGRDSEGDIVGREPQEVIDQITTTYRRQHTPARSGHRIGRTLPQPAGFPARNDWRSDNRCR